MSFYQDWLNKKKQSIKSLAVLVDPDKVTTPYFNKIIEAANNGFIDYFFVGGSLITTNNLDKTIKKLKSETQIPVILFPGSTLQVNTNADAILLLSLVSGRNPELLIGKHVEAAPVLAQSNLEIISTAYMLIDSGKSTSALYMSGTTPIPYDKPEIAQCTAMAAEMLGLKCTYLEAGSGAVNSVSTDMIKKVAEATKTPLIVGGGIRDIETAKVICNAGADIIVVGTSIENNPNLVFDVFNAIQTVVNEKITS